MVKNAKTCQDSESKSLNMTSLQHHYSLVHICQLKKDFIIAQKIRGFGWDEA